MGSSEPRNEHLLLFYHWASGPAIGSMTKSWLKQFLELFASRYVGAAFLKDAEKGQVLLV